MTSSKIMMASLLNDVLYQVLSNLGEVNSFQSNFSDGAKKNFLMVKKLTFQHASQTLWNKADL